MEYLIIVVAIIVLILILKLYFKRITIFEYEKGLKYSKGKFKKVLGPGQYWIFQKNTVVTKVDVRPKFVSISGQEVLSSDSIVLKVSLAAKYEIKDPDVAINKVENYAEAFYLILQLALREIIGSSKIDEILEKRSLFGERIMELTSKNVEELGLKLLLVNVKDIMFPGDLKKIFAQVVKAQKEGLAALEKARGESAALRNLANAAKVLENNPALMQLRMLQLLGESSGNTLVLGMPGGSSTTTPLPIKSVGIEKPDMPKLKEPQGEED